MTHIVGAIEGYYEYVDKFMKFWEGRTYANGNARVRPRIILPVHFGINECGREEFLADLKSFMDNNPEDIKNKCGPGVKSKMFKIFGWIRKILPQVKSIEKEMESIKSTDLRRIEGEKGNHFILSFYPMGEIKDIKIDGREIV